ncbi:MAG TPA: diguanylate cyclase [Verrucomicrobiae bacterium]|nr:diguanylate cyclase [Verrucomicrobiae bacterium]
MRQTAEILSSGTSLVQTFERFCLMLAEFIDASVVFVALRRGDEAHIDFAYDHGSKWRFPHMRIEPQSQSRRVLDGGEPILIRSLDDLDGPIIPLKSDDDSQSAIFVPLRFGAETIGVLSAQTTRPNAYGTDDLHLLQTCALYVAVAAQAETVRSEKEQLQTFALRDALTGVANRRTFDQRLRDDWSRAQREGCPLALLVLDVDWFKRFNDTYGHIAGDACLNQVARAAQSCIVRESDLFARYGGEEFTAILWSTDAEGAAIVAERILAAVRALDIPHAESPLGRVTVSIGVASVTAGAGAGPPSLVQAADRAMYGAKAAGRDRVVVDAAGGLQARGTPRVTTGNLRTPATTLLGRTAEIAAVAELLKGKRMVSVVGSAGIGKSRVAIAAAQRRLYAFPDGGWMLGARGMRPERSLEAAILALLGIGERPDESPRQTLLRALSGRRALLLLDDCTAAAPDGAGTCEAILQAAPELTILATGAQPLGIAQEAVYELCAPRAADAAALFIDRAQTAATTFAVTERTRALVDEICQALAYVPLAVELTAARARTHSLEELAAALRAPSRPGSAGVIAECAQAAYGELRPHAQRLFERLAVFGGAFTGDAARDVAACGDLEPWDLPEALGELCAANLLESEDTDGTRVYALAEPLQAYAHALFEAQPEAAAVRLRLVRFCRALVRRAAERIERGALEDAIASVEPEVHNVACALEYALVAGLDLSAGAEIAVAMRRFWLETGRLTEGRYWIDVALRSELASGVERAELLYAAALTADYRGDMVGLASFARELVAYYETLDDPNALAKALNGLASAQFRLGDAAAARDLYDRAMAEYRRAGNERGTALVLLELGSLALGYEGDTEAARRRALEALPLLRRLGPATDAAAALSLLADISLRDGRFEEALGYANESLAIHERLGSAASVAEQLLTIAAARLERGELRLCADALRAARAKLRQSGSRREAHLFEVAFLLAFEMDRFATAAELLGGADRLRAEQRVALPGRAPSVVRRERQLEARLGSQEFARCRAAGAHADPEGLREAIETLAGSLAAGPVRAISLRG